MNNETLIRLITAEVLKRLGNAPPSKPRVGVVLSATASEGALQSLRSVSERGFVIDRIAVGMRAPESLKRAAATYGQMVDGNVAGTRFSADSRALIAPELSSTDAGKLANGVLDDAPPEWLWAGLASGIPILASGGDGFSDSLPSQLKRIADGHRSACARLGVQWYATDALAVELSALIATGEAAETVHVPTGGKRSLVTETLVANLAEGTRELIVPTNAVVTPLARDLARRRGIALRVRR